MPQEFVQLGIAEDVASTALTMQVVGGQFPPSDKNLSEQRYAAPASPLQESEIGGEPAWLPEIGLLVES